MADLNTDNIVDGTRVRELTLKGKMFTLELLQNRFSSTSKKLIKHINYCEEVILGEHPEADLEIIHQQADNKHLELLEIVESLQSCTDGDHTLTL